MKQIIFSMTYALLVMLIPLALGNNVYAQANLACDGLNANTSDCSDVDTEPALTDTIKTLLNILSFVAGIIAVIMVIIAGTRFITSQGDPGKVASARNAIIYAVVGLVIIALAQVIVFFVLNQANTAPAPPEPAAPIILEEGESCPRGRVCAG